MPSQIQTAPQKVFVYGTLKRGEPNHHWLTKKENGSARFLREAKTKIPYPLVVGTRYNVPSILDKPGIGHNVTGEIYVVDDQIFANLDTLEAYPQYYDREKQEVITETGTELCWMYLLRNFPEKLFQLNHLESYQNTMEKPYSESYVDSNKDDMHD